MLCRLQFAVTMASSVSLEGDQVKQKQRIEASKLYFDVPPDEKASFVLICIFPSSSLNCWEGTLVTRIEMYCSLNLFFVCGLDTFCILTGCRIRSCIQVLITSHFWALKSCEALSWIPNPHSSPCLSFASAKEL